MATNLEYIEYICDQLRGLGIINYRKMFGEYMVYIDYKPIILVCDNQAYVKMIPETTKILGEDAETGYPYQGAKEHYTIDVDNKEILHEVCHSLVAVIPLPKPKKKQLR
ncbi:MAG: TfoX/Sxy family protein [Bacilli bacterium]|jgi:TfoX/Sxy family transcriptional regulator of competence genes|nr:TfoX/Sxy family protein [Bacilli bacterium]MDD4056993.1 TfoX/Sxy family protein [Bacilli bacterium]MDY0209399.1 TfoX/Sxy family protein [Bacilli bacterium]